MCGGKSLEGGMRRGRGPGWIEKLVGWRAVYQISQIACADVPSCRMGDGCDGARMRVNLPLRPSLSTRRTRLVPRA